jgi:sugar phosphate isomerase/epimerase
MKLSVAIAGSKALPSAFVVWRGFEESIKKAAEYGYNGVELALKTADEINRDELQKWLSSTNMEVSCISTGQVFADLGLYFTHPDAEVRSKVVDVFHGLIDLAKDFGNLINVGRVRGFRSKGQTPEQTEALFIDTARRICDAAASGDVDIILEPVNRYEINFINNLDEGAELIGKTARSNLGLMPDVFHMNIEDAKLGESLLRHSHLIRYIHLADSNRLAPGLGHLNFEEIFQALYSAEFDGWAAIEILPEPDPDTAARKALEFTLPMIEKYNQARMANDFNKEDLSDVHK